MSVTAIQLAAVLGLCGIAGLFSPRFGFWLMLVLAILITKS